MSLEHHGHRELPIIDEILEVCRLLHQRNLLAAADGNVSYRLADDYILITSTGKAKAFIEAEDLAVINLEGKIIEGQPSAERLMHLAVYRACPTAKAVVHAHPPNAVAWTIAKPELKELPNECMSELILATGKVPIVPYARPTTNTMGENLKPFLPECKCMILARHGALSWGESIQEAYYGMERMEHSAEILRLAATLGTLSSLPAEEIKVLKTMREQIGNRTL